MKTNYPLTYAVDREAYLYIKNITNSGAEAVEAAVMIGHPLIMDGVTYVNKKKNTKSPKIICLDLSKLSPEAKLKLEEIKNKLNYKLDGMAVKMALRLAYLHLSNIKQVVVDGASFSKGVLKQSN